jgi:hypothetical protein
LLEDNKENNHNNFYYNYDDKTNSKDCQNCSIF